MRALLLALVALAIAAPAASAHATLEATTPARGAAVKAEPAQVVFRFDEPVEGTFGAVRVFDAKGARVDDNHVGHPGGAGEKIAVGLRSGLAHGAYTATYRVVSADGHTVSGGFVFDIGAAGAAPGASVADLLDGAKSGPQTAFAMSAVKAVGYLAIAVALGGMLFLALVWGPALRAAALPGAAAPFARRATRLLVLSAAVGAAATAAGIVLEGATAAGTTFWGALDSRIVHEVLQTHFGAMWAVRLGAWLLLGTGLAVAALRRMRRRRRRPVRGAGRPAPRRGGRGRRRRRPEPGRRARERAARRSPSPRRSAGPQPPGRARRGDRIRDRRLRARAHARPRGPRPHAVARRAARAVRRHPRRGDERVAGRPRVPAVRGPGGDADARARRPHAPARGDAPALLAARPRLRPRARRDRDDPGARRGPPPRRADEHGVRSRGPDQDRAAHDPDRARRGQPPTGRADPPPPRRRRRGPRRRGPPAAPHAARRDAAHPRRARRDRRAHELRAADGRVGVERAP